jgi:hypothetical protein
MKHFNIHGSRCPKCGSKGHSSFHDTYDHHLTDYYGGQIQEGSAEIRVASCSSCEHTYSVLPDLFVPHKSYSILFIILVLRASIIRTGSIEALCSRYGIAVSTYYRWKNRYRTHKSLCLDKLEQYFFEKDPQLAGAAPVDICFTSSLYDFYSRFGFSLLQYSKASESGSP